LYAFPRASVVPGHEHKIFIPYTKLFHPLDSTATTSDNALVHGSLTSLSLPGGRNGKSPVGRGVASYVPLNVKNEGSPDSTQDIHFDYLVYGLGSHLPPPINLWSTPASVKSDSSLEPKVPAAEEVKDAGKVYREEIVTTPQTRGSKTTGMKWLRESQDQIRDAESVLVIGAGALGVRESKRKGGGRTERNGRTVAYFSSLLV
jgi:hypothetical protein